LEPAKEMITYIEFGDIFHLENVRNYAHGCNCAGAMGKGIAVEFKKRYPEMYKQYKNLCLKGEFIPGSIFPYNYGNGYVFNLGTQLNWKTKADLNSIASALDKMLLFSQQHDIHNIALPKIGAGLGGLDWGNVKTMIEEVSSSYSDQDLYIVENYKSIGH
jgi:O-acetyl-ADP-ribose deacetylase (regulator of RNase III)